MLYLSNIIPKPNARYTHSCGCKRSQLVIKKNTVHGLSSSKFYRHWRSMFDRMSPNYIDALSYVGISVCDRWKDFGNFTADMYASWLKHNTDNGGRNTTLERKNTAGNYTPENCKWATQKEQARNKKNTTFVEYQGRRVPLVALCESLCLKYGTVRGRILKLGYSLHDAITCQPWQKPKKTHRHKAKQLEVG